MKRVLYLLFCLCMLSCQSQNEQKPENMIPQEKMVRILADIHITEALIETNVIYPDTALMVFNQEQAEVFKRYDVTKEQFKDTYNYYLRNINEMNALYEIVVDTLSLRESKASTDRVNPEKIE